MSLRKKNNTSKDALAMNLHSLSMDDDEWKACYGRAAKLVVVGASSFLDNEAGRGTPINICMNAIVLSFESIFVGLLMSFIPHEQRKEILVRVLAQLQNNLIKGMERLHDEHEK